MWLAKERGPVSLRGMYLLAPDFTGTLPLHPSQRPGAQSE
jgi:hypothetical protein